MEKLENHKKCICLVDDNLVCLNTGKSLLQNKYTIVTIPSGEKLLALLEKAKPDLILLDVEMPGMNGYDTIKELKANPNTAGIPVIFLTGKDEPENEFLGLSLGAVDYITKPFSPPLLFKRIELQLQLESQKRTLCEYLTWVAEISDIRNEYTGRRAERIQGYLKLLLHAMIKKGLYAAEAAQWNKEDFFMAALLYDVGIIKIHHAILLKEPPLTDDELKDIKLHVLHGKMLLESLEEKVPGQKFLDYAKTLSYSHHEKWDGTGYPDGLKGEQIPLEARMVSIADVYDALVSNRPYRKALSHEQAMQIISGGRNTQFDPELAGLFSNLSDEVADIQGRMK